MRLSISKIANLTTAIFTAMFVLDYAMKLNGQTPFFTKLLQKIFNITIQFGTNQTAGVLFLATIGFLTLYNLYEALTKD